jgi:enamine deaminase RidA (YjgF/YER057c/UK114 family)
MTDSIAAALAAAGHVLPQPAAPVAAYVPTVLAGNMLYVSGQVSFHNGALITGRLGDTLTLEQGQQAAQACGLMLLAQAKAALGSLDRIERVVKLGAFVTSTPEFTDQPKVANGASELMITAFGDAGRHSRSAVGVPALPLGAAVEIDAVFAVRAD